MCCWDGHGIIDTSAAVGIVTGDTPRFEIIIDETTAPVLASETLSVTATVENVGGSAETTTVELAVPAEGTVNTTDWTVATGEQTTLMPDWETDTTDDGTQTVTVTAGDDQDSQTVDVETPGELTVSIIGSNDPVGGGDPIEASVLLENGGDRSTTEAVV